MTASHYQLLIVGGGPAGLTAGLYAARARITTLLIEKAALGGQVLITDRVENYPGFADSISGYDLMDKMAAHAERFGLEKKLAAIASFALEGREKRCTLENGEVITADAIILCNGARARKLDIPGEREFAGRGVSYCATCDGPFYRNQEIAVVGGGNTAVQEALHLTRFASKVTIIHRRDELRATKVLQERAFAEPKIEFLWNSRVSAIQGGQGGVEALIATDNAGREQRLAVTGVFMFIGIQPNNEGLPLDKLQHDRSGFLLTDEAMATTLPGVFAAGDIRSKRFRQIVNATSEGAVAALSAEQYLEQENAPQE